MQIIICMSMSTLWRFFRRSCGTVFIVSIDRSIDDDGKCFELHCLRIETIISCFVSFFLSCFLPFSTIQFVPLIVWVMHLPLVEAPLRTWHVAEWIRFVDDLNGTLSIWHMLWLGSCENSVCRSRFFLHSFWSRVFAGRLCDVSHRRGTKTCMRSLFNGKSFCDFLLLLLEFP